MIANDAKFCPKCGEDCEAKVAPKAAPAQPVQPKPAVQPIIKPKPDCKKDVTSCGYSLLGIFALIASLSFSAVAGLVLGIIDYKSANGCPKGMALAAIIISCVRILAYIIAAAFGASALTSILGGLNQYGNGYSNGLNNGLYNFGF